MQAAVERSAKAKRHNLLFKVTIRHHAMRGAAGQLRRIAARGSFADAMDLTFKPCLHRIFSGSAI